MTKIIPSRTAPVGSRQWAACLRAEFPDDFIDFFGRQLSYQEACDEYRSRGVRRGFASKLSFPASRGNAFQLRKAELASR